MTLKAVPPDGVIARAYAAGEETMGEGARLYMRDCLLRGMRGEQMPEPKTEYKLAKAQKADVRHRAHSHLPEIDLIRAGERSLSVEPAVVAEQDVLPF
jgi:hypothetical protein